MGDRRHRGAQLTEAFCPVAPGRARGVVFARTLDVVRMLVRILKSAI